MGLFNGIIGNASEVDINKVSQEYDTSYNRIM